MRIGDVHFREQMRQRPWVVDRLAAMHHDDQRAFTPNKVDEQLEEGIYGKGLLGPVFRQHNLEDCERYEAALLAS